MKVLNWFRFVEVWFDVKLTGNINLEKVQNKCKEVINILNCLTVQEWGASRASLKNIY